MKALDELIQYYEDKMCENDNTPEEFNIYTKVYSELIALQDMLSAREFEYKDTIRMLVGYIERRDFDGHNSYDTDILSDAKRLSKD